MMSVRYLLVGSLVFLFSIPARAALTSYLIDGHGFVYSSSQLRYYGYPLQAPSWILDDTGNTMEHEGYRPAFSLSAPFRVSDITNVTAYDLTSAWVTVAGSQYSYQIDDTGNVINQSDPYVRYFQSQLEYGFYWMLDGSTNSIFSYYDGLQHELATSLFSVNDITDVTAYLSSNGNHAMWVTVSNSPLSYLINTQGEILGSSSSRIFNDRSGQIWALDSNRNTIRAPGSGESTIRTDLFDVSDIVDITGFTNDHTISHTTLAWVLVDDGLTPVPLPAAVWLFGTGLISLIGIGRFKRRG